MHKVNDQLYYSGIEAAADQDQYRHCGIEHVIQLTYEEPTGGYPDYVDVHTFSMRMGHRMTRACSSGRLEGHELSRMRLSHARTLLCRTESVCLCECCYSGPG